MRSFFLFMLLLSTFICAQNYKKIKINISSVEQAREISALGIPLEESHYDNKDNSVSLFLSENEFELIKKSGIQYEILIDDWKKYFLSRPKMSSVQKAGALQKIKYENNVTGFGYGSLAGFYTLQEVYNKLDTMHLLYPQIVSEKIQIDTSFEGRPIYAVKISDNYNQDEDEPEVFYNAMIHAREPEAMMTVMYFMFYLIENYGIDDAVTYLVNNREFYFVPVINVDGYEYNRLTEPGGGGMWRKNRNGNGIDLNRNFGYEWGYDNIGSSSSSGSETYRGISAFSEPETRALRDFCNGRKFKAALNYHTYGNYLISPWGYENRETQDSSIYREFLIDMTKYNKYTWGTSGQVLYITNGDSDDWMYGEQNNKGKIIAMTPEVGTEGFWPPMDRIFPLAKENVYPNLYLAWAAGGFVSAVSFSLNKEFFMPGDTAVMKIKLKNKGLSRADNINLKITSLSENAYIENPSQSISFIDSRQEVEIPYIKLNLSSVKSSTSSVSFKTEVFTGNTLMSVDTFSIQLGKLTYILKDNADNLDSLWNHGGTSQWLVTKSDFFSKPSSFTNFKNNEGYYKNNDDSFIQLKIPLDISFTSNPVLSFYSRYNIERDYDYGQIKVSTDNGMNWQSIGGEHSTPGTRFQVNGEPIYEGLQSLWLKEEIDLSEYITDKLLLRFELKTDSYQQRDGWYLDDISIHYRSLSPADIKYNKTQVNGFSLSQNYPNPFNPVTNFEFQIPATTGKPAFEFVSLRIYNILGNEVATLINEEKPAGSYKIEFDGTNLSSGIYFYRLNADGKSLTKKMILLK